MNGFTKALREGQWLTLERVRVYSVMLLVAYVIAIVAWCGLADGLKDRSGSPIGTDFLNVYSAGVLAGEGHPEVAYDWPAQHGLENKIVGYDAPYYGWHYPPPFLAVARLLAMLPYTTALALYLGLGFAAYFFVLRRLAPKQKGVLLSIAAFPAVFVNIGNGQNGFISTTLMGLGLAVLTWHPWLAGFLFGLLAYKPQFFVLIPLFLLVDKNWRALLSTCIFACANYAASYLLFGAKTWQAFFTSTQLTQHTVLEAGTTGWNRIQSVFSAVRLLGGSTEAAYIVQGLVATAAVITAVWIWRQRVSFEIRAAALCVATLLLTPYLLDYDLVILALPLALLSRQNLAQNALPYEKTMLAILWLSPLVVRSLGALGLPLMPILLACLLILCFRRAKI